MENFFTIVLTIFGGLIGSFLNAVIHRVPRNISIVSPRSCCPKCKKLIYWYENIPILSYLFLRGKCSKCHESISIRYPIIEALCALVAFFLVPKDISLQNLTFFLFYFSIFATLLAQLLIDIEHQLLPNSLNLFLLIPIIPFVLLTKSWEHWLFGGLAGFGFPFLITWGFYVLRGKVGLGGGDIKLYGVLGLLLGLKGIFLNIFLSCFLGSIVGVGMIILFKLDKSKPIPFGPFIIIVASFQIYFPQLFKSFVGQILNL